MHCGWVWLCAQAVWAAVVFNSPGPAWDYTIRMNYTNVPFTDVTVNTLQVRYLSRIFKRCCPHYSSVHT